MKENVAIVHATIALTTSFDEEGVRLRPLFSKEIFLAWEELEFVCVTPAMERTADGWRQKEYASIPRTWKTTLETRGLLELALVIRDRRPLIARTHGWWTRSWIAGTAKPMLDAADRLRPDQACLRIDVYRNRLSESLDVLLNLVERRSRFDLVVFDF